MTLVIHILAGGLSLVLGAVALSATKGAALHRKSGMLFIYTMLTMAITGLMLVAMRGVTPAINIPAASVTAYLVITALLTVRPPSAASRWLTLGAMLVAFGVGLTSLTFGFEALASGTGSRKGIPAFPFFLFGIVALAGGVSDFRIIRFGGLKGVARLTRHLWRMCFALFITAQAFFLGQSDELPEALRHPVLLAAPILAVFLAMLYWLWRVRIRQDFRDVVSIRAHAR